MTILDLDGNVAGVFTKKRNTIFFNFFDEFEPIYLDIVNTFSLRKQVHFFLLVNKLINSFIRIKFEINWFHKT
jgi:hypothetical protein